MSSNSPISLSCRRRFPETRGRVYVTYIFQLMLLRVEFKGESLESNRTWACIHCSVCVTLGDGLHVSESQFP